MIIYSAPYPLIPDVPPVTVKSLWVGQTSSSSVIATANMTSVGDVSSTRLAVSTSASMTSPVYSSSVTPDEYRLSKHTVTGLTADTQYYCAVEIDGTIDTNKIGKFKTHPAAGASSFKVAFASCSIGQNQDAFSAMLGLSEQPLFFVHMGDFHYGNPASVSGYTEATWHGFFDTSFSNSTREQFHREIPTIYTWSDHDFANNDATGRTASNAVQAWRTPAIAAFRRRAPVTPHSATTGDPVYYSFVVGRVRFVVSDLRSDKTANSATDNSSKTMMGATQKAWFKSEIDAAKTAGQVVAWISEIEWQYPQTTGDDTWAGYTTERTEIADYIKSVGMTGQFFVMSGNLHALSVAYAADYATGGGCPIPAFQAAPLDHTSASKGGPWDQYYWTNGDEMNAYGILSVDDDGTTCTITYQGYTADNVERVNYSFIPLTTNDSNTFAATGYSDTYTDSSYRYYRFLSSGSFIVSSGGTAEYLVVAGGGAGAFSGSGSGGGGAGGVLDSTTDSATVDFSAGTYSVVVGAGGIGSNIAGNSTNGSDSYVQSSGTDLLNSNSDALRTVGGGCGGDTTVPEAGASGGSGGGGGANASSFTLGGIGTTEQGFSGGNGWSGGGGNRAGGGGGGAGAAGVTPINKNGGNGGIGRLVWGSYYGGGGGGVGDGSSGDGGLGGGGYATKGGSSNPVDGTANTGGGGGGSGAGTSLSSGNGGSGVVIFRVPLFV